MRNNARALRRLGLVLTVLFLVCLPPFMGTPRPSHDQLKLVMFGMENVEWTTVYMNKPDGQFYWVTDFSSTHQERQMDIIPRQNAATRFYLEVKMTDGTVRISEPIDCTGAKQQYKYDVKTNTLKKKAFVSSFSFPLFLVILLFTLCVPFGIPLLSECFTAYHFKLKPMKHVVHINIVVISLMFCVLTYMYGKDRRAWWHFYLFELVSVIVEYLFYRSKYKDQSKKKLLTFTILANAVSGVLFELILYLFY